MDSSGKAFGRRVLRWNGEASDSCEYRARVISSVKVGLLRKRAAFRELCYWDGHSQGCVAIGICDSGRGLEAVFA